MWEMTPERLESCRFPRLMLWSRQLSRFWYCLTAALGVGGGYIFSAETGYRLRGCLVAGGILGYVFIPLVVTLIDTLVSLAILAAILWLIYWGFFQK